MRFDVTADVLRVTNSPEDMRHVVSYDIIMDGIRAIVARGHVELSEALAEQVAAHVLEDPRVMRVTVRVEKLELGPGGVGVEIERKRAKEQHATLHTGALSGHDEKSIAEPRQEGRHFMRPAVVKLGGSTASAAGMDAWIAALAGSGLPLVIVPGGGPFADQVRQAQKRLGFSDGAAHAMAILAMDQFGHVILDRDERLIAGAIVG